MEQLSSALGCQLSLSREVTTSYHLAVLFIGYLPLPTIPLENTMFRLIIYWFIFNLKTTNMYLLLMNLCLGYHLIRDFMHMYMKQYFSW